MFEKKTDIISRSIKSIESVDLNSKYLGKKVYSKSGEYVGSVCDVAMRKGRFAGVLVKGNRNVLIEKELFESESEDTIMLKIEPVTNIIGKQVFDSLGKRIGKIVDLNRKSNANAYTELVVKKSFFRKAFNVPKEDVEVAKKNVILKKAY